MRHWHLGNARPRRLRGPPPPVLLVAHAPVAAKHAGLVDTVLCPLSFLFYTRLARVWGGSSIPSFLTFMDPYVPHTCNSDFQATREQVSNPHVESPKLFFLQQPQQPLPPFREVCGKTTIDSDRLLKSLRSCQRHCIPRLKRHSQSTQNRICQII